MSKVSAESLIRKVLIDDGLKSLIVTVPGSEPPYIIVRAGGNATDTGMVLGSFVVWLHDKYDADLSVLAGRVWHALWESDYFVPLTWTPPSLVGNAENYAHSEMVTGIVLETTENWWDPDSPLFG